MPTAIVLKTIPFGDNDLIITLFDSQGKLFSAVARGAQVSTRRFGPVFDLFNRLNLKLDERKGMPLITAAELMGHSSVIREDIRRFAVASFFSEVILRFVQDADPHPELYSIYDRMLVSLEDLDRDPAEMVAYFQYEMLSILGFEPVLNRCLKCEVGFAVEDFFLFSLTHGGIVCRSCSIPLKERGEAMKASVLLSFQGPFSTESALPKETLRLMRHFFEGFFQHVAGKPFKSISFLNDVL